MFKLCKEHGRFVHEVFPDVFGNEFTPEEFVTWQAYDLLAVCARHELDPREYDKVEELIEDIDRSKVKEELRLKKLTGSGAHGN